MNFEFICEEKMTSSLSVRFTVTWFRLTVNDNVALFGSDNLVVFEKGSLKPQL